MNIAIIGCGSLGTKMARLWNRKGFFVTATTRLSQRLNELTLVCQRGVILKEPHEEELASLISHNELLFLSLTVDSSEDYEDAHLQTAQMFRHLALEMDLPRQLIYASNTSVYGSHEGRWVDETSSLLGNSDSARTLIEAERAYLSLQEIGWTVCVLRFAEIYGPQKTLSQKVSQMRGQTLPGSGEAYTNMVHEADCLLAIEYARKHNLEGVFNLVDDDHPSRKELYTQISQKFHFPPITWNSQLPDLMPTNKRVSNHKMKAEGFVFTHPHRVFD